MGLLREIDNLMKVDPTGWTFEYGGGDRLQELFYGNRIAIVIKYEWSYTQAGRRTICIFPGNITLGWWDRLKFDRMLKSLIAHYATQLSREAAQKIIDQRNQEIEATIKEIDDSLAAQFAQLEEADRKERQKLIEAPVANGFFRGAKKRLQKGE
jgi:hypothetical protein